MTRPRDLSTVLVRCGRLALVLEPRDVWIGVYVSHGAVYVCLLPCLPVRWERRPSDDRGRFRTPPDATEQPGAWLPGMWRAPDPEAREP